MIIDRPYATRRLHPPMRRLIASVLIDLSGKDTQQGAVFGDPVTWDLRAGRVVKALSRLFGIEQTAIVLTALPVGTPIVDTSGPAETRLLPKASDLDVVMGHCAVLSYHAGDVPRWYAAGLIEPYDGEGIPHPSVNTVGYLLQHSPFMSPLTVAFSKR